MEFLNPPALYALSALPLLLVPYLIRRKPKRQVFSSLLLLQSFATRPERRFWGKLRLPLVFFLQLLLLALLIGASGDPVLPRSSGEHLAIVLDNSASMQAMENGVSRFDLAKQEAVRTVRGAPTGARVDVYLTVPWTGVVGEDLPVGSALALLENTKAYDLGDTANDYGELLERLVREQDYHRLFFFTDRHVPGTTGAIRGVSVGQPQDNVAITGFDVALGGLGSAGRSARVEVSNFSSAERSVEVVLLGDGKRLGARRRRIVAGQSVLVQFDEVPAAPYYEARIETEDPVVDPLSIDNRRFSVVPGGDASTLLGVSPRPEVVESLRSVSGLRLEVIQPQSYRTAVDRKYGLEIFHLAAPGELPPNNAVFILPPEQNPVATLGAPVADATVSGWSDAHPSTRYVNFSLLRPRYTRPIEAKVPAHSIVESPEGPLVLVFERDGFRYAVLGFDPLPFLGRQNLPMSIFTLNLLGWLQDGMTAVNQSTGDPLKVAREVRHDTLTPAWGDKDASLEAPALFQGVYERFRNGKRELVAVNFAAPAESNLLDPGTVVLEQTEMAADAVAGYRVLWPYLILLCLFLLTIEWFMNPPHGRAVSMINEQATILRRGFGGKVGGVRRFGHNVDHVAARAEPPGPNREGRRPNPEPRIRP